MNMTHKNYSLYYFNPNRYSLQFYIMAESIEVALEKVKEHLKDQVKSGDGSFADYELWKDATISSLPLDYTIEVYPPNIVIESEIS